MRLLDLYSGRCGSAVGYARAGFDVTAVDHIDQPGVPDVIEQFLRDDALAFVRDHGHLFDVITASPPCHVHSKLRNQLPVDHGHVDLIPATRAALIASGKPYVIENVEGAPLLDPLNLCGSMFDLGARCVDGTYRQLRRHRWFESNVELVAPRPCRHDHPSIGVHGGGPKARAPRAVEGRGGYQGRMSERREAMGIDWMTRDSMSLAIPPAYTEWLGAQLLSGIASLSPTG